jgi:hypothetical protein
MSSHEDKYGSTIQTKFLADFNRPVKRQDYYPDLRFNFTTQGAGSVKGNLGREGKAALKYNLSSYLTAWWRFDNRSSTIAAYNEVNSSYNGSLVGTTAISVPDNFPILVRDSPEGIKRPQASSFNESNTSYLISQNSSFCPSRSDTKGYAIQAWVNLDTGSTANDTIFSMGTIDNTAGSPNLNIHIYRMYFDSDVKLVFRMYEGETVDTTNYIQCTTDSTWSHVGGWAHILVYVTQTLSSTDPIIHIFVNGVMQTCTTSKNGWGGLNLSGFTLPSLTFGALRVVDNSGSTTGYTNYFKGSLAEIAFWREIPILSGTFAVNENVAGALYHAKLGYYTNKSGFLSEPPRIELRDSDSRSGAYPTIMRTGDKDRAGTSKIRFDDTRTVIFSSNQDNVKYPQVSNSDAASFFFPSSSIGGVTGSLVAGISDTRDGRVKDKSSISAFDDSRIYLGESSFYMTGTSLETMSDFTSPLKSKVQIRIDLNSSRDQIVTRFSERPPYTGLDRNKGITGDHTGMVYYNFETKRWDQIGLEDPGQNRKAYYDWSIDIAGSITEFTSGTELFPMQFSPAPNSNESDEKARSKSGCIRAGTPSLTSFAPHSTKYHATSSQCLRLSDYISHPFLLEKIVVDLPVEAQRIHSKGHQAAGTPSIGTRPSYYWSAERDQDDYVFFMYRQQRVAKSPIGVSGSIVRDSIHDVSSSERFLIASGSMCFYNSTVRVQYSSSAESTDTYSFEPLNSPAFSHDFGMAAITNFSTGAFTGSVRLELTPSVASAQALGGAYLPETNRTNANAFQYHYWPGGTNTIHFGPTVGTKGEDNGAKYTGKFSDIKVEFGETTFDKLKIADGVNVIKENMPVEKFDPRAFKQSGGTSGLKISTEYTSYEGQQSVASPYLLLPEDELILGIDAALSIRKHQPAWEITGSFLRTIGNYKGKKGSIVLYGSMIKDGKPYFPSTNQQLDSHAIHEALHYDNPVVDQYDISGRLANIGTYLDNHVTGSIFTPDSSATRWSDSSGIGGSFILGTANNRAGAFNRFVTMFDQSNRFYDTLVPGFMEYSKRSDGFNRNESTGSQDMIVWDSSTTSAADGKFYIEGSSNRQPFPYIGDPNRIDNDSAGMWGKAGENRGSNEKIKDNLAMRQILYTVGFQGGSVTVYLYGHEGARTSTVDTLNHAHPSATGSTGFRYGIMNIIPEFPRNVFRRDRFGQFRDMLEQGLEGRFYKPRLIDLETAKRGINVDDTYVGDPVVTCRFTLSSSNQEVDPYSTTCSNVSFAATSSLPYFDGEVKNNLTPGSFRTVTLVKSEDLGSTVRFRK